MDVWKSLQGFVKVVTWICQGCSLYFSHFAKQNQAEVSFQSLLKLLLWTEGFAMFWFIRLPMQCLLIIYILSQNYRTSRPLRVGNAVWAPASLISRAASPPPDSPETLGYIFYPGIDTHTHAHMQKTHLVFVARQVLYSHNILKSMIRPSHHHHTNSSAI